MMVTGSMDKRYEAVVIGVSAGGMQALPEVLLPLSRDFPLPLIIVQHMAPTPNDSYFIEYLNGHCALNVKEADEKELISKGNVYIAPADYHLMIEKDRTFSFSIDNKVNYSRPSIDVLFESAADVFQARLIGIVLTGSNSDGALGLKKIKDNGGLVIVQDPETADAGIMPASAIKACRVDHILPLKQIGKYLNGMFKSHVET